MFSFVSSCFITLIAFFIWCWFDYSFAKKLRQKKLGALNIYSSRTSVLNFSSKSFMMVSLFFSRLATYGLAELQMEGDGNCQVRWKEQNLYRPCVDSSKDFVVILSVISYVILVCQFRALADQLFRNADYHKHVRKHVVKQVLSENHNATLFLVHKFIDLFWEECLIL